MHSGEGIGSKSWSWWVASLMSYFGLNLGLFLSCHSPPHPLPPKITYNFNCLHQASNPKPGSYWSHQYCYSSLSYLGEWSLKRPGNRTHSRRTNWDLAQSNMQQAGPACQPAWNLMHICPSQREREREIHPLWFSLNFPIIFPVKIFFFKGFPHLVRGPKGRGCHICTDCKAFWGKLFVSLGNTNKNVLVCLQDEQFPNSHKRSVPQMCRFNKL